MVERDSLKNVLLITLDAVRKDYLGCYGSNTKTDNINRLGESGIVFEQAIAAFGGTPVSHASILFGTTPVTHGCIMIGREYIQPISHQSNYGIQDILKDNGYRTGAVTSVFSLSERLGFAHGFDYFQNIEGQTAMKMETRDIAAKVNLAAQHWLNIESSQPWFLWLHYFDAHPPFYPPDRFLDEYKMRPYQGEIVYLDWAIGELLKQVDLDETLVIITSDHGTSFGEHGVFQHGNFYEDNLRVPLIFTAGGVKPKRIKQLVRTVDIVPTILDILGIEYRPKPGYHPIDGVSLLPLINNDNIDLNLEAYCGVKTPDGTIYAAIRTKRYKYIVDTYSPKAERAMALQKTKNRIADFIKNGLYIFKNIIRMQIKMHQSTNSKCRTYLFDLKNDPDERINLLSTLHPYIKGLGRENKVEELFPTFDMKKYYHIASQLHEKLQKYLLKGQSIDTSISREDKAVILTRLRGLGYID